MRRMINGFGIQVSFLLFAGCLLSGCNGESAGDSPGDPLANTGMLRQVHDASELESVLKKALLRQGSPEPVPGPAANSLDFSTTYTVEAGVDELDFVRFDGTHLYVAPRYIGNPGESAIRILRTEPASASATQVGSIPIRSAQGVLGMYVANERLFLILTESYFGPFGDAWPAISVWAPSKFVVQVYDLRDPEQPRQLMSASIDGTYVESRRIEDRVVIVSRHTPRVLHQENLGARLALLPLSELMAGLTLDGRTRPLVDPRRCYVANEPTPGGYAVLTYINTFSLANPRDIDGICYDAPADGVYSSLDALYVSEPLMTTATLSGTRIHKFSLRGTRPDYAGSAELQGSLWFGGQRDFRMNENAGLLRVFTTEWTGDSADFVDHRLYVLRQKTSERALEIIGRLPNDARPEEIGKPNEGLFGIRFAGNRAYAVTFQRIDPLYVIDLSTPTDPRIAGQLLLPGVSDFLHPVTNDLLLGLGMDSGQVKLELFDASVLEHPQSRGAITLGGTNSNSEALQDRHAFTWLAGNDTDRFAIPAAIYTGQPGVGFGWNASLHQFEIAGKQAASSAYLRAAGAVTPPGQELASYGGSRSFISGNTVYYVRDGEVWSTFWSTPSQINGPF